MALYGAPGAASGPFVDALPVFDFAAGDVDHELGELRGVAGALETIRHRVYPVVS
jgi:hypothetical protein